MKANIVRITRYSLRVVVGLWMEEHAVDKIILSSWVVGMREFKIMMCRSQAITGFSSSR